MTILSDAIASMRETSVATATLRAYYNGEQASAFSKDTSWTNPARKMIEGIRDNQCKGVVDTTVDRLQVSGFATTETGDVVQEALAARAYDLWQTNRMDLHLRGWLTDIEVTGRPGALIVYPDSTGAVRVWAQSPEQVAFARDAERPERLVWLAKRFWDGEAANVIVYTVTDVEVWRSRSPLRDPDAGTYDLVSSDPHPFGFVPAIAVGLDGQSDVELALPLQDMLNQALANVAITSQAFSLPLRVITGLEVEIDPETGEKVAPFSIGLERTLLIPGAEDGAQPVTVEDLPGQSPEALLVEADSHRRAIAATTRTPVHLLLQSGNFPSGEALRTAEAPFTAKVKARQAVYGVAIADALAMATVIDYYLNTGSLMPMPNFETVWVPAVSESAESNARVLDTLVGAGVPLDVALVKVMGWDTETARVIAERANVEAANRVDAAIRRLDAGL